jgi:hypothetical protein
MEIGGFPSFQRGAVSPAARRFFAITSVQQGTFRHAVGCPKGGPPCVHSFYIIAASIFTVRDHIRRRPRPLAVHSEMESVLVSRVMKALQCDRSSRPTIRLILGFLSWRSLWDCAGRQFSLPPSLSGCVFLAHVCSQSLAHSVKIKPHLFRCLEELMSRIFRVYPTLYCGLTGDSGAHKSGSGIVSQRVV